jgi:signal transduction histidine kinase/CheY-like chemotaxis protein
MKSAHVRRRRRTADDDAATVFAGGGGMGALMRAFDWASTPLGPVSSWPQSLKTTVGIVLACPFPMLIWWGPELRHLYNDAYRPILGAKHPASLGQTGSQVWAEIWDILGPRADKARSGAGATFEEDLLLPMDRFGYVEETYFTFSYSPIPEPTAPNGVGGVLVTCTETTGRVIGERRVRALRDLGAGAAEAKRARDAAARAAGTLAEYAIDLPFVLIYLLDERREHLELAGSAGTRAGDSGAPLIVAVTPQHNGGPPSWPLCDVVQTSGVRVVDDVGARFGRIVAGPWEEPVSTALVQAIPSPTAGLPTGVIVAAMSPRLALDESFRGFVELIAGQIGTAVANARAYEAERKRAEALAELDRAKTTFFSNVSHEFRTPLTLILAPTQDALADPETLPATRERLTLVERNARRLLKLVNTLLDFSRIEAGRANASYAATDFSALTADLVSVFRAATEKAGLTLTVSCPPLADRVYLDREMWEKIVLNLLSNAFKHTFHGEIVVATRTRDGFAELEVRDTGVGIPADEIPLIFDRFHRVPHARSRTHEGTGIGLSLVRELVRLHGGEISVESEVDRGTTFTVRIPLGTAHLPAERINVSRPRDSLPTDAEAFSSEAMRWLPDDASAAVPNVDEVARAVPERIIVADDNADMRSYFARLLRERGWIVEPVTNGQAALDAVYAGMAAGAPPDIVLSDVMMPGLDGVQLLARLRADPATSAIPVILVSARAGEEARVQGLEAGADDYLVKPFSARELLTRVETTTRMARERQAVRAAREAARADLWRVFEQAPVGICVLRGPQHVYEMVNPHYQRFIPGRVVIGKPLQEAVPELKSQGIIDLLDRVRETGEPFVGSAIPITYGIGGAGELRRGVFDFVCQPLTGHDGAVEGIVVVASDVTEITRTRRESEEALRRAKAEAEQANRVKSEFLAKMSHELRTPLNAIAGHLQLLEMGLHGPMSEAQRHALDRIDRSQRHLLSLINDVLNLARIEAGRVDFQIVDLDLGEVVADLAPLIEPQLAAKSMRYHVRLPEKAVIVRADREKLQQILLNLLSNAVKFTPAGGTVTIDVGRRAGTDDVVFVRVSDTGRGIPRDQLESIFEPFVQVDVHRTRTTEGVGLGLSISRDLARGMGGNLRARSEVGKGSTFTLTLPRSLNR